MDMQIDSLKTAIHAARTRYEAANPKSREADLDAEAFLPGGNTRTVLHFDPFPLTMADGEEAELTDLDGHRYVDFVGEYSAGLFGHSNDAITSTIDRALAHGYAIGAPTVHERKLAELLCNRFPAIDLIRFCNSGTEANIWAMTTARMLTGRDRFMAFNDAYHGGVIKFPGGPCPLNLPFDFVLADFNDTEGAEALIRRNKDKLAAVIVEPIMGAGGNIPGNRKFLEMLRRVTQEVGALLIFDEVKTARIGPNGCHGLLGFNPDLVTLGKFIGGGHPIGAFGGSAEVMQHFNPKLPGRWNHAGTFNNDVFSMSAGCAAMGEIFTPERAQEFFEWSENFRLSLNELFAARDVPMYANGMGSIIAIHFSRKPTKRTSDITAGCKAMRPLLHMELLLDGILVCSRGDLFLSLPMTDDHLDRTRQAFDKFAERFRPLIIEVLESTD
jgi:glutamate-1-semialdehyde 2,1-aminomutase